VNVWQVAEQFLDNPRESGPDWIRASCPFHRSSSSSRSFMLNVDSGHYHCLSERCGARGSLYSLLVHFGVSRDEARAVASEVRQNAPTPKEKLRQRAGRTVHFLDESLLGAYDFCPNQLVEDGFDSRVLRAHDVGVDEGLRRFTFAIRDVEGRLVAISGRSVQRQSRMKYKVYGTKELPDWYPEKGYVPRNRDHLYRLDKAKNEPGEGLILVEGFKACLWLVQHGVRRVVAVMGSSLTNEQRALAADVGGPYYVWFDHEPGKNFADSEGRCAAARAALRLTPYGPSWVCAYPPGTPPGTAPDDLNAEQISSSLNSLLTPTEATLNE
jgi:DNA primase